jgi:hypothetical protein
MEFVPNCKEEEQGEIEKYHILIEKKSSISRYFCRKRLKLYEYKKAYVVNLQTTKIN